MGITGLLPFLEKSSKRTNIEQFSGGTVAIDSYCWLHKGAFSCADKLAMGVQTDAYVHYCMKFVHMLLSHKIKPILVFDGRYLPAKAHTEAKRRESRQANRRKGLELIRMGQDAEGRNLLRRSLDVSHEMALELIKHCQKMNIDCIVAPYEADAQLAYLNISGIADVVITEDSDLIIFGCNKVFFKMDTSGNGLLIDQQRIHLAMDQQSEHFDIDVFRNMCILSGCDYLPSLPGIGLGKARKFIMQNGDCDIHRALTRLGSCLNMKSLTVTKEYRDAFVLAIITFKHQLVFCPLQRKQVRLNPPTPDITVEQLRYAGEQTDPHIALQLAYGNCDPFTFKMLHNFDPDTVQNHQHMGSTWAKKAKHISIWSKDYRLKQNQVEASPKRSRLNIAGEHLSSMTNPSKKIRLVKDVEDSEYDELTKKEVLDIYQSKSTEEAENDSRLEIVLEEKTSPVFIMKKNPFSTDCNKVSPSLLAKSRSRIRGRNLMRTRRTIIDEGVTTESKFFAAPLNEKDTNIMTDADTPFLRVGIDEPSTEEEVEIKQSNETNGINSNLLIETNAVGLNSHNVNVVNHEIHSAVYEYQHKESSEDICEDKVVVQNIRYINTSMPSSDSGKSHLGENKRESVSEDLNTSESCDLDELTSSIVNVDSDFFIQQKEIDNLHSSLFNWSNTKLSNRGKDKVKDNKRNSSSNCRTTTARKMDITSRNTQRSKQLRPEQSQQSLLSMFGFAKKDH